MPKITEPLKGQIKLGGEGANQIRWDKEHSPMVMKSMDAQLGLAGNPTMLNLGGPVCYSGPILTLLLSLFYY